MKPQLVRTIRAMFVLYIAALALVVFLPASEAKNVVGFVGVIASALDTVGIPREPAAVCIEFLSNVVLFLPLGLALRLLVSSARSDARLVLFGCCASVTIELVQLAIPGRVTALSDVVANTAGTFLGVAIVSWLRRMTTAQPAADPAPARSRP